MTRVLYPGTFDPITNGHLDIIDRSSRLFEEVIVTIALNSTKQTLFADNERIVLIEKALAESLPGRKNIVVEKIEGLLVEFARKVGADGVVRGLRTLGDFEYEMQMALMNRRLHEDLNTIFLPPDERYLHLSSSIVREVARYNADISDLVPDCVAVALREKFRINPE